MTSNLTAPVVDGDNPPVPDPFDPVRLRLSQDFAANLGVKKALLTVPVRKPSKEWWFQTHPDEAYRIQTCVVDLKEDKDVVLKVVSSFALNRKRPSIATMLAELSDIK